MVIGIGILRAAMQNYDQWRVPVLVRGAQIRRDIISGPQRSWIGTEILHVAEPAPIGRWRRLER